MTIKISLYILLGIIGFILLKIYLIVAGIYGELVRRL